MVLSECCSHNLSGDKNSNHRKLLTQRCSPSVWPLTFANLLSLGCATVNNTQIMQKHRKRVCCPCILFSKVSECDLECVLYYGCSPPLLWKQIPPRSPQLRLVPFFSVKEHSHMSLFWLQGVILTLPRLSSTALLPGLVIGACSGPRCADLTLSQFVLLLFLCFVWTHTRISSLRRKCLDFEKFLCLCGFLLLLLLFLACALFFPLFCPPLSRNQLNPSIPHSDSSAVLKEEQRSEGCGWAEWWIKGLEKAGVGTSPEFMHLLPAPCHQDIVHLMVDKHNWSWKSPTCSVSLSAVVSVSPSN